MKKKSLIATINIIALLFISCTSISDRVGSVIGETTFVGEQEDVETTPVDLPNNLNPAFSADLQELAAAPRYMLEISLDQDDDLYRVTGTEQVIYTNQEKTPLEAIYFKLIPNMGGDYLAVADLQVDAQAVEPQLEFENTVMRVDLPSPLDPNHSVEISMQIDVVVPSQMGGNYGLFIYMDNVLALDAFFPIIPVYNDEGWNVEAPPQNADVIFSDVAFFTVSIDAPQELVLVAGGHEVERSVNENRQLVTYHAGPQRDFYLAASPDFTSASAIVDGVKVTSYFPEYARESGENVLETAQFALQNYAERFGPYPYTELDLVSTPMQAGGMEYSNITALGLYLYDPEYTLNGGLPASVFLEGATAHEVAHMWFYCQVMNDQIDHPWQDESLVQYATYLYYVDRYGEEDAQGFLQSFYDRWDRVDREPISISLPAPAYQGSEYGAIIYGRGAIMFDEMRATMGKDGFDQFLTAYVDKYRWQVVEPEDLLVLAEETCECDLSDIYAAYGVAQ